MVVNAYSAQSYLLLHNAQTKSPFYVSRSDTSLTWLRFVFAGVTNRVLSSHGAKSMVWSRPRAELLSVAWVVFPDRSWRRRMVPLWNPLSALNRQYPDIIGHDLQEGLLPWFGFHGGRSPSHTQQAFGVLRRGDRVLIPHSHHGHPIARTCAPAFPGPARRCCHHVVPGSGCGEQRALSGSVPYEKANANSHSCRSGC